MYLSIMISIMPMIKSISALIVKSRHLIGFFFCFFFLPNVPFLLSSALHLFVLFSFPCFNYIPILVYCQRLFVEFSKK